MKNNLGLILRTFFRQHADWSQTKKGHFFEQCARYFFSKDKTQANTYRTVQLWSYFVYCYNRSLRATTQLKRQDLGIDLVLTTPDGRYFAVQCKYYADDDTMTNYREIQSFLALVGSKKIFAGGILVTTGNGLGDNLRQIVRGTDRYSFVFLDRFQLSQASFDWSEWILHQSIRQHDVPELFPHQKEAVRKVIAGFRTSDRGQLIMACGTGKTRTALAIMEGLVENDDLEVKRHVRVLVCVPSISLVNQTLIEFNANTQIKFDSVAVCSDRDAGRKNNGLVEQATSVPVAKHWWEIRDKLTDSHPKVTVVFSTYQSLPKIQQAQFTPTPQQHASHFKFDLIICDEAHRTTGRSFVDGKQQRLFSMVHHDDQIAGCKRLYMTATSKIYEVRSASAEKIKQYQVDVNVISMDDEQIFGPEFYRYNFRQAIEDKRLVNYEMIIMTRDTSQFSLTTKSELRKCCEKTINANRKGKKVDLGDNDLNYATKLWGAFEVVAGQVENPHQLEKFTSLQKVICFNNKVGRTVPADSPQKLGSFHNPALAQDIERLAGRSNDRLKQHYWEWKHIDGSTPLAQRRQIMDWLSCNTTPHKTRVVTNVRCLGEGVDVPALDAVLFLDPKQSTIDIIQAIGRVMRLAPHKQKGYIILPIVLNDGVSRVVDENDPELQRQNQQWKTIIKVVNALAAIDDSFAEKLTHYKIRNIDSQSLQRKDPTAVTDDLPIKIVGSQQSDDGEHNLEQQRLFDLVDTQIRGIITIAGPRALSLPEYMQYIGHRAGEIKAQVEGVTSKYFTEITSVQTAISQYWNTDCSFADALTLVIQHLIIYPCFVHMFGDADWLRTNPVVTALEKMVVKFRQFFQDKMASDRRWKCFLLFLESKTEKFRHQSSSGASKQAKELEYFLVDFFNDFWRYGFPREQKRYGIVYTPYPVIAWMVTGLDYLIKTELKLSAGVKHHQIKMLDPFVGTGSFLVRIAEQYGQHSITDFIKNHIFAVEIQPVAYYWTWLRMVSLIQTTNRSQPKDGLNLQQNFLWADTFKLIAEQKPNVSLWPQLNQSKQSFVDRLKQVNVIISNPPYAQNLFKTGQKLPEVYPQISNFIQLKWARHKDYKFKASQLYNLATFSWAWICQMLEKSAVDTAIIALICPNTFLKAKGGPAMRDWFHHHFAKIYAFDLRGNYYDKGLRGVKSEGENIFGDRSTAGIQIIFAIWRRQPQYEQLGIVNYCDVNQLLPANDLTTVAKLKALEIHSFQQLIEQNRFRQLRLNKEGDWFGQVIDDRFFWQTNQVFRQVLRGLETGNNTILFNFSADALVQNVIRLKNTYDNIQKKSIKFNSQLIFSGIKLHPKKTRSLNRNKPSEPIDRSKMRFCNKTPFVIKRVYYSDFYLSSQGSDMFNDQRSSSQISLVAPYKSFGSNFTVFCLNHEYQFERMYFHYINLYPLFFVKPKNKNTLWPSHFNFTRAFMRFMQYDGQRPITAQALLAYIYGLLWSADYRTQLRSYLHTHKPVIAKPQSYQLFSQIMTIGQKLIDLHAHYHSKVVIANINHYGANLNLPPDHYRVTSIELCPDQNLIKFNKHIILREVPSAAYFLKFDGVTALKHFSSEHRYKYDRKLNIIDDPNELRFVQHNPRYLLEMLLKIIHISIETKSLVRQIPPLNFADQTLIQHWVPRPKNSSEQITSTH